MASSVQVVEMMVSVAVEVKMSVAVDVTDCVSVWVTGRRTVAVETRVLVEVLKMSDSLTIVVWIVVGEVLV